ncbi:MAG: hypothetical protein ABSB50_07530 [Terracidiphilus sp.]|jgi:hypothetical protein
MKRAFVLLCACLFVSDASAADKAEHKVTPNQAEALVLASLTPKERRLPSVGVELDNGPNSSRFLFATVTWAGTPNGSVVVDSYAVDSYTGDVFSAVMSCYEETNRNLRALQKQVRTALNLTKAEYEKLKTKGPLCEE